MTPQLSRTAGALYLAIAVFGGFSIGFVPDAIGLTGDAATIAGNVTAHLTLYKLGILADIAVILCELALTAILYVLFRGVSPTLSAIAMISRAGMITIMGVNLLIWVMPLGLLGTGDQMVLFFRAHELGVFVWQVFFGLHLLTLGWIAVKTGLVPRFLGWGLFVGAFGYLIQGIVKLVFVDLVTLNFIINVLLAVGAISELGFAVWLLIWGAKRLQTLS